MNRIVRRAAAAALLAGGLGSAGCMTTGAKPAAPADGMPTTGLSTAGVPTARGAAPDGCPTGQCGTGGYVGHTGRVGPAARAGKPEGWSCYYDYVDPCWPQRYSAVARAEVVGAFAAQVNNGHVLNQTVWNWYFEPGTDVLTPAGAAKLDSISQARPQPDARVYLQVARDVPIAAAGGLDTIAARREELTAKRADVVKKYMAAQPTLNPVAYEVYIHDPVVVGMPAEFSARAYRGQLTGYVGGLTSGGAAAVAPGGAGGGTGTATPGGTGGGSTPPGGSTGSGGSIQPGGGGTPGYP